MPALRPSLNEIYSPIEKDLALFSEALKKELASKDELIESIHTHLLKISGKFLRPALTILASKIESGARGPEAVMKLAVAIELIHTATLVHDDIIDDSELRRNQPSVYYKWGREISIVSGDYLYAKAFLILAGLRDLWVNEAFAACAHVMCEGEMKQIERRNDFGLSEEDYFKIIHKKTAALFQAACMGGAYFSGADTALVQKMGEYGFNLGMAFQIVDDCLDIAGETESLGKTAGLDILKNDVTLPALYLFQGLDAEQKKHWFKALEKADGSIVPEIKKIALEAKVVDRAMAKARQYANSALESLKAVKNSAFKESLVQLVDHCIERIR